MIDPASHPGAVRPEKLETWTKEVLVVAGVRRSDAAVVARCLVEADLRGHHSHGVDLLPAYVRGFEERHLDPEPDVRVVHDSGAVVTVDGGNGLGHVVADFCCEIAIERARQFGVAVVCASSSNHFGMAGHWPLKAVRAGMIGHATTNGPLVMAPWGGRVRAICNNPLAWGIPAGSEPPIVLDMALTAGARGKIRLARQRGDRIPAGWAIDSFGEPTVDPADALDGVMLPLAEHKGSGLAVVNEVLASALSGASSLGAITAATMASSGVHSSWGIGHFFVVLDPGAFRPIDEFLGHVDSIIAELRATPPAPGFAGVEVPGARSAASEARGRRDGLRLDPGTVESLTDLGRRSGIEPPY
jgi:LDH2 family malate/lactate/ureidoglycolate dehydrogenase